MKKVVCFIFSILLCVTLAGCSESSEGSIAVSGKYCNMVVVESVGNGRILQDTDTGVLYLWYKYNGNYGQTLTPLYNADGTLKNISDYEE